MFASQSDERSGHRKVRGVKPYGFRVFFRDDTGLTLNNSGDEVRLLGPDGLLLDSFVFDSYPGADVSWSRAGDGAAVDQFPI